MVSEYEKIRLENIAKNKEILASLGLDKPLFEPKEKRPARKAKQSKKRKAEETNEDLDEDSKPAKKLLRNDSGTSSSSSPTSEDGPRRSARHAGKVIDYNKPEPRSLPERAAYSSGVKKLENDGPMGREDGKRTQNPKQYGHIPGIAVGTWWSTRIGASVDAIHAPPVGGISGTGQGAHSVALSGGYEDDVDLGYAFTYTGSGAKFRGRDLKGTKDKPKNLRTAPQSSDQTFDNHFNKMLLRSSETKKPVRVIRGFKCPSKYAPSQGYRYDGLYTVEKAWLEKGNNPKGYLVCKYAFKRLPEQPPLSIRAEGSDDEGEDNQEGDSKSGAAIDEVDDAVAAGDEDEDADGEADNDENAEPNA
ncbi:PUA-like domain-containing protein [Crepidotus variabilis]|uniref:PUA-like domain-containing protein n=1 Tax=Crepidotus variabilis TaxID=179855 RepID=A0A9P6JN89_9AGAR|nr:PUA-like domain-containing protein [Crepidotus variabilis]